MHVQDQQFHTRNITNESVVPRKVMYMPNLRSSVPVSLANINNGAIDGD